MPLDFDRIYATDLSYVDNCWKLCGDGHCCTFDRYKAKFRLIGTPPAQQLPLLPGEYQWLSDKGHLPAFKKHERRATTHEFKGRRIQMETMVGKEPGCLCTNAFRTTICRLYPVLPCFDVDGTLVGADMEFGSFEMLEELQGLPRVCRIETIPLNQLERLLAITREISRDPVALFYVSAYRLSKQHARARLVELGSGMAQPNFFSLYEMALIRKQLVDLPSLDSALGELAGRFENHYGTAFSLE